MPVAIRAITRIQEADDINVTLGAGVDEYALAWDNDTARFVLTYVQPVSAIGKSLTFNGVDQLAIKAIPVPTNFEGDTELLVNGGFETKVGTVDDGITDTFTGWTNVNSLAVYDATATARTGSIAVKLISGVETAMFRQVVTVTPATRYGLVFWTTGDGINAGRYSVYDVTNGAFIVPTASTGVTASTPYTLCRVVFDTPAGCTSIQINLIGGATTGMWARFDDVSLRQLHAFTVAVWVKRLNGPDVERQYFLTHYAGSTNRAWAMRFIGSGEGALEADIGKLRWTICYDGTGSGVSAINSLAALVVGQWYFVVGTWEPGSATNNSTQRLYIDGVLQNAVTNADGPIYPATAALVVGATNVAGSEHYFNGEIGEIQIVKDYAFTQDDASLSFERGLANNYSVGSMIVRYLWEGSTNAAVLQDRSLTGNDLAGTNVSVSNQATGTKPYVVRADNVPIQDHGQKLSGLLDDDHTQYALLVGRPSGQVLSGGSAADEDLILHGTSHGTKTSSVIALQPSGGQVGIGTLIPTGKLTVTGIGADGIVAAQSGTTTSSSRLFFMNATTGYSIYYNNGVLMFSGTDALPGSSSGTTRMVLSGEKLGVGITAPATVIHGVSTTSATNALVPTLTLGANVTGAGIGTAGLGPSALFQAVSSTTVDTTQAKISSLWYEATHATRKSDLVFTAYDSGGEREGIRIRANGSAPAIGFLGAGPLARIAHIADPAGGGTVDAEARSAINSILATLEGFGFHAVS